MHVIKLDGYNATVDNGEKLELGTFDSFGEEQLQIVKAPDWGNLSVIATFNPPNRKPVQVVVDSVTGVIKVPKEATAGWYGVGTIVFVGLADGVQRISSDVEYIIRRHSNASGTEPAEPTPSVVEQILTEAQNANVNSAEAKKTATDAKDIAQRVRTDVANGKFNGAKGDTGAAGKDGLTPHIGENGNWWIGDTDTGISVKGVKGDTGANGEKGDTGPQGPQGEQGPTGATGLQGPVGPQGPQGEKGAQGPAGAPGKDGAKGDNGEPGEKGAPGADGKSAYQYAQDGGYTGTETDFIAKLAQEILSGTTDNLTPEQVYAAVSAGRPVKVQYTSSSYGVISFTAFSISETMGVIASQSIAFYDGTYILAELGGYIKSNQWFFNSTVLAQKKDIPTVPSSLKNPNALTIKIGSTTVTYDGSTAQTVTIADGTEVSY